MARRERASAAELASGAMPTSGRAYVAIITDGNGRWARARGVPVNEGHSAGADTVKARLRDAAELGIEELTVYSFSTENWSRPAEEVAGPDGHVLAADRRRNARAATAKGCACASSAAARASAEQLREQMGWAEELTGAQHAHHAVRGVQLRRPRGDPRRGAALHRAATEEEFRACLYAPEMHDPDLIIRTSGERRLSNYLLWQSAYSELVFREELWPDFTRAALEESLAEYAERRRRFGGR